MTTHDDDTDPTGMRALLRGLPDPGPMPDDLTDRITASLAALGPLETEHSPDGPGVADVSRGTVGARPRSWWARHGSKAAIAAVFLVGGGAVASGPLGLLGSRSATDTTAAGAAASTTGQPESARKDEADSTVQPDTPYSAGAQAGGGTTAGEVTVRHSGRDYTAATLATQLESQESLATTSPLTAEAPAIGPIGTEIGVRSCLEALGLPRDTAADVDLGTFDGTPTAILVVTLGGGRTAYAVGRDCTSGHPSVLAGPITLP